jgi:hypothetical protein
MVATIARRPNVFTCHVDFDGVYFFFSLATKTRISQVSFLLALNDGWISTYLISSCPELHELKLRAGVNSFA